MKKLAEDRKIGKLSNEGKGREKKSQRREKFLNVDYSWNEIILIVNQLSPSITGWELYYENAYVIQFHTKHAN